MPNHKHLILIGGGHSHALVLNLWRKEPPPNVHLTLISPDEQTPYSGMLPGLVAGHYRFADTHIDLLKLCRSAGANFVQAMVAGLDLVRRQVHYVANGKPGKLDFDLLSINAGITPDLSVPGSEVYTTPVKPISGFYPRWQKLQAQLVSTDRTQSIGVVGGGAAGVELIQALHHALHEKQGSHRRLRFYLIQKSCGVPEGYPPKLQHKIDALLRAKQIQVITDFPVAEVKSKLLVSAKGRQLPLDHIFWCTHARAANWFAGSGLTTDVSGFIATNDFLQSSSHKFVFAAGDIAQQTRHPRSRAGVFAVRQGPILFENLRRYLIGQPLKPFVPQKQFLSLLACGNQYAVGCRLGSALPAVSGKWVWRWKDRIDRRFMGQFHGP